MTDRDIMQQALEALEFHVKNADEIEEIDLVLVTALRGRLAQPEPDFYGYASRLAVAIWEQHYKDVAPQWKPLDDLIGVLTQIDNMTAGLTRLAQPEQEPVAWADMDVRGEDKGLSWTPGHFHKTPLYNTPPQRKPLTDEEIEVLAKKHNGIYYDCDITFARAIEAAHGIKGEA